MEAFPRPLSEREKATAELLLPVDGFPDSAVYREQLGHAVVARRCPCGCATVDLEVDRTKAERAGFISEEATLPVEAYSKEGRDPMELIMFARDGWLESLELVYYGDRVPTEFPDLEDWQLVNKFNN